MFTVWHQDTPRVTRRLRDVANTTADERVPAVFDNDRIYRILLVRRRDCVPTVDLHLTSVSAQLVQRRQLVWLSYETS